MQPDINAAYAAWYAQGAGYGVPYRKRLAEYEALPIEARGAAGFPKWRAQPWEYAAGRTYQYARWRQQWQWERESWRQWRVKMAQAYAIPTFMWEQFRLMPYWMRQRAYPEMEGAVTRETAEALTPYFPPEMRLQLYTGFGAMAEYERLPIEARGQAGLTWEAYLLTLPPEARGAMLPTPVPEAIPTQPPYWDPIAQTTMYYDPTRGEYVRDVPYWEREVIGYQGESRGYYDRPGRTPGAGYYGGGYTRPQPRYRRVEETWYSRYRVWQYLSGMPRSAYLPGKEAALGSVYGDIWPEGLTQRGYPERYYLSAEQFAQIFATMPIAQRDQIAKTLATSIAKWMRVEGLSS